MMNSKIDWVNLDTISRYRWFLGREWNQSSWARNTSANHWTTTFYISHNLGRTRDHKNLISHVCFLLPSPFVKGLLSDHWNSLSTGIT